MDKFFQEWIFGLIFGAVLLVQLLLKYLSKQSPQSEVEVGDGNEVEVEVGDGNEDEAGVGVGFEPDALTREPTVAAAPQPAQLLPGRAVQAPLRVMMAPARRFSRRALMGDRRSVQDAIVIATILGPCRANRPRGSD